MFDWLIELTDHGITEFTQLPWPPDSLPTFDHTVRALLAIFFVCLICGTMGALVVGNRMAFFSDALAHCAFAGVALGLIVGLAAGGVNQRQITLVMVLFGVAMGVLIAFVRETTNLANDTVIGVFYAAAVGLGAIFMRWGAGQQQMLGIEAFIFGDPNTAQTWEILLLAALSVGTILFLIWFYNPTVMASANTSLALSRRVPVRLCQYLLIVLLGIMVNLSIQIVGALLINGLLIVPAAAAANVARNLRQMFWFSMVLALVSGIGGYLLHWEVNCRVPRGWQVGTSGCIVVLAVLFFVASMLGSRWLRQRAIARA